MRILVEKRTRNSASEQRISAAEVNERVLRDRGNERVTGTRGPYSKKKKKVQRKQTMKQRVRGERFDQ